MENKKLLERLLHECDTMRSRARAILTCDEAIAYLVEHDVFGKNYRSLLEFDCESLSEAIDLANDALGNSPS